MSSFAPTRNEKCLPTATKMPRCSLRTSPGSQSTRVKSNLSKSFISCEASSPNSTAPAWHKRPISSTQLATAMSHSEQSTPITGTPHKKPKMLSNQHSICFPSSKRSEPLSNTKISTCALEYTLFSFSYAFTLNLGRLHWWCARH